jgi:hypothetical protein
VVIPVVKDTSASKLAEIEEAATLSAEEKNMSTADEAEMEEQQEEAATSALEEGESVSEQADDDEDLF